MNQLMLFIPYNIDYLFADTTRCFLIRMITLQPMSSLTPVSDWQSPLNNFLLNVDFRNPDVRLLLSSACMHKLDDVAHLDFKRLHANQKVGVDGRTENLVSCLHNFENIMLLMPTVKRRRLRRE